MEVLSKFLLCVLEPAEALESENYFWTVCCLLPTLRYGDRKMSQQNKICQRQDEKEKRRDRGENKSSECRERQGMEDIE